MSENSLVASRNDSLVASRQDSSSFWSGTGLGEDLGPVGGHRHVLPVRPGGGLGLATPAVAAQISTWVADKVTKVTRRVNDLISSFQALSKLLNKIQPIVTRLKSVLDKIGSKSDDPAGTGHGPDDAMGQHQTRRHRPELQGHLHPQRRRPVGRRWPSARR